MAADAQTQAFLEKRRGAPQAPPGSASIADFRAAMDAFKPLSFDRVDLPEVRDVSVPGQDGTPIAARIYRPSLDDGLPVVVWAHGGSWLRCDLETHDPLFRVLADRSGCVLVGVDFRRAPEHRFPTALEDVHAVLRWTAQQAASFGADGARLAVGGESSGGNLAAAAACLLAESGGDVNIVLQVLVVPVLDARLQSPSWDELGADYLLTASQLDWALDEYAPQTPRDHPRLSPLLGRHEGLPEAIIVTGELDPLRDDGQRYATALERAGVAVTYRCVPGMIHHAVLAPKSMDVGARAVSETASLMGAALRGVSV